MLIAQALGEYGAINSLIEGFTDATERLEGTVGSWGTEGLMVAVGALVLWRVVTAF